MKVGEKPRESFRGGRKIWRKIAREEADARRDIEAR